MRTTTKKLENAVTQIKVTFDKKEWAEAQDAARGQPHRRRPGADADV